MGIIRRLRAACIAVVCVAAIAACSNSSNTTAAPQPAPSVTASEQPSTPVPPLSAPEPLAPEGAYDALETTAGTAVTHPEDLYVGEQLGIDQLYYPKDLPQLAGYTYVGTYGTECVVAVEAESGDLFTIGILPRYTTHWNLDGQNVYVMAKTRLTHVQGREFLKTWDAHCNPQPSRPA